MGAEVLELFDLDRQIDVHSRVAVPLIPRKAEASLATPTLRLLGGQELILDPVRAGPGGWSVSAGADGTTVFTNSLEGWTYFVIPPD